MEREIARDDDLTGHVDQRRESRAKPKRQDDPGYHDGTGNCPRHPPTDARRRGYGLFHGWHERNLS